MKHLREGSVLMEFLIVLPVYMLIFGFVFVAGELSLQALHLVSSGDRSYALAKTSAPSELFDFFKRAVAAHDARDGKDWDTESSWKEYDYSYAGDGGGTSKTSSYKKERIERPYDGEFKGPWTQSVAAWVKDDYTLTPLTRGIVAFWYRENARRVEDMGATPSAAGALHDILGSSSLGRVEMVGKEFPSRKYSYYCMRRTDDARNIVREDGRLPYRIWPAGALCDSGYTWLNYVAFENRAETHYSDIDGGGIAAHVPPEAPAGDFPAYKRNSSLRSWMP